MTSQEEPFHPDGLTADLVNALLLEARVHWDRAPHATSALMDGSAAQRRERREARRAIGAVVRALPHRPSPVVPDGEVA